MENVHTIVTPPMLFVEVLTCWREALQQCYLQSQLLQGKPGGIHGEGATIKEEKQSGRVTPTFVML